MIFCNDYGEDPLCLGEADPQFTMDFTDVEKGAYLYWCAVCGPKAHSLSAAIDQAVKKHGNEFIGRCAELIEQEDAKRTFQ